MSVAGGSSDRANDGMSQTKGHDNVIANFVRTKSGMISDLQKHVLSPQTWNSIEYTEDIYAILPPLDRFMKIKKEDGILKFWEDTRGDDVVIGRVFAVHEWKLNLKLLCFDCDKSRDIENYNIEAQCEVEEIPKLNNHDDPLSRFKSGALVRARVIKVKPSQEKIYVSFFHDKLPKKIVLGIIQEDDALPTAYKRQLISTESYDNILLKSAGFSNPNCVQFLMSKLGISKSPNPSLLKQFHKVSYKEEECAQYLRNRQCHKVANKAVQEGVKKFKKEKYLEALNDFNYALDMDTENVDALVARGALFANRSSYMKAISDFENALKLKPTHRNAKDYLVEVLIARGKKIELEIEDIDQVLEIEKCYVKALKHNSNAVDALNGLKAVEKHKTRFENEKKALKEKTLKDTEVDKNAAAKKIREMLQSQLNTSKRKLSSSSSSSSNNDSSSSSNSSSESSSSSSSQRHRKRRGIQKHSRELSKKEIKRRRRSANSIDDKHKQPQKVNTQRRQSRNGRNSTGSMEKQIKQSEPKQMHARITSSRDRNYNYENLNKNRRHSSYEKSKVLNEKKIDRRNSISTASKITKDNVSDILSEISKYEKLSK